MKVKIFSKGNGWYISATNYKDEKDKAYVDLYFPTGKDYTGEPEYIENDRGYSALDIDIQEARFTSYHKKVGMTIFKYDLLTDKPMEQSHRNGIDIKFEEDELPFY